MGYIFSKWKEIYHDTTIKISFYAHVFVASGKICERPTLKKRDREKDVTHVSESVHRFQGPLRALPPEDFNFFLSGVQGEPVQEKIPTFSNWLSDSRYGTENILTYWLFHKGFPVLVFNCYVYSNYWLSSFNYKVLKSLITSCKSFVTRVYKILKSLPQRLIEY